MLFAAVNPAGREGNGGGADAELVVPAGATVMVAGAELIVGAGVGVTDAADKGAAEVAGIPFLLSQGFGGEVVAIF